MVALCGGVHQWSGHSILDQTAIHWHSAMEAFKMWVFVRFTPPDLDSSLSDDPLKMTRLHANSGLHTWTQEGETGDYPLITPMKT